MSKSNPNNRGFSPHYKVNNKGGYGNPPINGQFKEGNKKGRGRRAGSTSLEGALRKMFRSKVPITRNGKSDKIGMTEAMAERAKKEILSGNYKALELGVQLARRYGQENKVEQDEGFDFKHMTPEQRYTFRKLS